MSHDHDDHDDHDDDHDDPDDAPASCSAAELAPLTVAARAESLPVLAHYCQEAARRAGLDARTAYRLRLAVDEVATNVITHGYPGATAGAVAPQLTLRVGSCGERELTLVLEDQAPPFDPRTHATDAALAPLDQRAEGGLGLFLVQRSVDALDYERSEGCNRNIFTVYGTGGRPGAAVGPARPPRAELDRGDVHLVLAVGRLSPYRTLQRTLDEAGYALTVTRDGRELLRLLHVRGLAESAAAPIDLVLVGRDLPRWASWLEQLRSDPRTAGVAVQVLTERKNVFDDAVIEHALAHGADDCLPTTLPAALTVRRIDASVERTRLQRELADLQRRHAELERVAHTFTGIVVPLGVALAEERDPQRLHERILGEAMSIAHAACGVLYLLDHERDALRVALVRMPMRGLTLRGNGEVGSGALAPVPLYDAQDRPLARDPAVRTALMGESVAVADVEQAHELDLSRLRALSTALGGALPVRSLLTVALRAGAYTMGVLELFGVAEPGAEAFGAYHRAVLESLAAQAALALHHRALLGERQSLRALEHELEIGRQIQMSFLPASLPRFSGWELAARLDPARAVSGDFYDTFELTPHGCPAFVVADVCDKGAGAAFFMGLTRSLLRAFAQRGWTRHTERPAVTGRTAVIDLVRGEAQTLSRILESAIGLTNDYIATNHAELSMFATMFFGVLEPLQGQVFYVNAGHPAALVLGAGGREVRAELARTGPAIGIIPGASFAVGSVRLEPGETLFAYTDGVTEARDAQGRFLGRAALEAQLTRAGERSADALLDDVLAAVERHVGSAPQHDDITLLAIRRQP